MTTQEIERVFEETGVLQVGHFLLTSGRHSDKYMQCAKIQGYPVHVAALTALAAGKFGQADMVVAPAVGAVVNGYELARQLNARYAFAEREDGHMTFRRGFGIPQGARVVVVEDTITTGGTVRELIELVKATGGVPVGVAAFVDRSGGKVDFGVPFHAAYTTDAQSWEAGECPICKEGKLPLISHGSRNIKR